MKKYFYSLLLLLFLVKAAAQQASRITQAAEEFGMDNPAGQSIEEMRYRGTVANIYWRNQWWQFQSAGHPTTQTLTWLDTRPANSLVGFALAADKIGETRQIGLSGRYAHTVAEGLKIGVSAGMTSHRIFTENLDQYDPGDPVAASAGGTRWRLSVGAGAFYHFVEGERAWKWFAGASFRRVFFLDKLPGDGESPVETDLLAQGGLGRKSWWAGARLRISLEQPGALDAYVRKYFLDNQFFLGGTVTSDRKHHTAGGQAGYEWLLSRGGTSNNHYLAVSLGFSKPLSKYVDGGSLIFDAHAAWAWERGKGKAVEGKRF